MDVYERAAKIRMGIDHPGFIAELDQEAMELRAECARAGIPLVSVVEAIFSAAREDEDRFAHAEAVAAWALSEPPTLDDLGRSGHDSVRDPGRTSD